GGDGERGGGRLARTPGGQRRGRPGQGAARPAGACAGPVLLLRRHTRDSARAAGRIGRGTQTFSASPFLSPVPASGPGPAAPFPPPRPRAHLRDQRPQVVARRCHGGVAGGRGPPEAGPSGRARDGTGRAPPEGPVLTIVESTAPGHRALRCFRASG